MPLSDRIAQHFFRSRAVVAAPRTYISRVAHAPSHLRPRIIQARLSSVLFTGVWQGRMSKNQATLGKFFGKPNGAKPVRAQQSTLAFGKKNGAGKEEETDVKDEDEEGEPKVNGHARDGDEDLEMANGSPAVKQEQADDGSTSSEEEEQPKSSMSATIPETAKRVKTEPAEDEDDERPRKKTKTAPAHMHKPQTATASAKRSRRMVDDEEDADEDEHIKPPRKAAVKTEDPEESEEASAEDEAEVESEEEEKPEVAAKAREKLQTTLKAKTKDAYPDWKAGEPVPYAALCATFSKIELTTKRLEILALASAFFQQVLRLTPGDLLPVVLLSINKLAADYAGIELGIGESLIMKAIGESTGRALQVIKDDQNKIGDLGLVAAKSRGTQPTMFKPKPLTVRGVHEGLLKIAVLEGHGAQQRKVDGIKKLLSAADVAMSGKGSKGVDITKDKGGPSEAKFIVRTLEGKLRLGLADKTVLVALAQALVAYEASQKQKLPSTEQIANGETLLKSVYSELPSYEVIIPAVLEHGLARLKDNCKLKPGVPLKPMLAKPTKSITEVLDRFEGKHFTCEYKYDGERAQIHFVAHDSDQGFATAAPSAGKTDRGISNIFSRNSEDLSKKYPDILVKLPTWVKEGTKSFVLDCETVAWDLKEKKVLPFQQLMTRKRKDVKAEDITVQVCVFAFDLLYLNGEPLVNQPFRARREKLHEAFAPVEGEFTFAQYGDTDQLDEIQRLLDESVKASCEGLMVKMLDGTESHYEPSRRSQNWLKVKKDYLSGVGDSLDLVVLGAYYGKGKRTSWYGAFLLACWNPKRQVYESVCNIGTGFSEAILDTLHETLSGIVIDKPKPYYDHSAGNKDQPDVWFEDRFVWEVKTADLTLSPRYKAAAAEVAGGGGKGVSLRFPRFIKQRDDKKPDQATSSEQIAELYQKQEGVAKNKGPSVDDDFEY